MSNDVYKVPNKPWWWPRSLKFKLILLWIVIFVILMNLQNFRIIAKSIDPFVLGFPFPLFFVFLLSLISTIVIVAIYPLWKEFIKRIG